MIGYIATLCGNMIVKDGIKEMKTALKIGSLLMAVLMVLTVVFSGCSLSKEWSYKSADKELAIGSYIYQLNVAYNQALQFAKDQLGDDYDGTKKDWLDKEIKDKDGNKAIAKDWIKSTAQDACLKILAVAEEMKATGATVDEAAIESGKSQSKEYWTVGPYAAYNYIAPYKDQLEPYGVSYDSFYVCTGEFSVNYSALFSKLYDKGGKKEVSEDEIVKYVNENYVDYSYVSVPLYESTTDADGNSTSKALSDKEIKKLNSSLKGYQKSVNGGESFDKVMETYMADKKLTENPATHNTELLENFSAGDELKKAVEKLDNGKATVITVGEGDNATLYLVYKGDIKSVSKEYATTNHVSVLSNMKTDDFDAYLKELAGKLEYEKNAAVDGYQPDLFFVADEPTTAAAEETTEAGEETTAAAE